MAIINGSDNPEVIYGTRYRDFIYGQGGADIIYGRAGDDDIHGGAGNDEIYGGRGADYIWGNAGVNDLWGDAGADRFIMSERANAFSDDWIADFTLDVDQIDVSAWGVSDFSQLEALFRTDGFGDAYINAYYDGHNHFLTIAGVKASELIEEDFIYANPGALNESGTGNDDVMFGSDFDDVLSGLAGNDILLGGLGSDTLLGGAGRDSLIGGDGDDTLDGGRGKDRLTGDDGADTFDFNHIRDSRMGAGSDIILDFEQGTDLIDVSGIDADADAAGNQQFDFIEGDDFTAAGQLRYENVNGRTILYGNTDADLQAEFRVVIDGTFDPTDADFIL